MINFEIERSLFNKNIIMIGVDEVGRGSWAGPLVATACWFDFKRYKCLHLGINDSKKLKPKERKEIVLSLQNFVKYCSSVSTVKEIDYYGLSYANSIAIIRAIFSVVHHFSNQSIYKNKKIQICIDGNLKLNFLKVNNFLESSEFKFKLLSINTLIKGDSLSKTIALASIISKEVRDTIMRNYSLFYPSYSFEQNKGYGTVKHKSAICHNGILDLHRKSFKPISTICSKNK